MGQVDVSNVNYYKIGPELNEIKFSAPQESENIPLHSQNVVSTSFARCDATISRLCSLGEATQ